jgi:ubiquinone/menaquinone biosynthesis C-methylase UbiE
VRKGYLLPITLLIASFAWAQATSTAASESADARLQRELRVPEIAKMVASKPGAKVADIGAGDGLYEHALADAVGADGRVYAEDITESSIKSLKERTTKEHLDNVEMILGTADDPKLPDGALDGVLMVIMYHEIANPPVMLEHVKTALRRGGRLVIVDMPPRKTATRPRADQVKNHVIAPDLVAGEVTSAGFEIVSRDDHFVDKPDDESTRWIIVFRKP